MQYFEFEIDLPCGTTAEQGAEYIKARLRADVVQNVDTDPDKSTYSEFIYAWKCGDVEYGVEIECGWDVDRYEDGGREYEDPVNIRYDGCKAIYIDGDSKPDHPDTILIKQILDTIK